MRQILDEAKIEQIVKIPTKNHLAVAKQNFSPDRNILSTILFEYLHNKIFINTLITTYLLKID